MPHLSDLTSAVTDLAALTDLVRPFQIEPAGIRGRLARLGPAIDRIIERHGYPDAVGSMLAEAATLAVLLAGALKYDGVFTLQTKGDGPIHLMVADVTTDGHLRAYAQYDAERLERVPSTGAVVPRLLGAGHLAFTVDQGEHTDRYQGIVALEGASLAECVHHYFRQSEQIEAGLMVTACRGAQGWTTGGIMLQLLPTEGGSGGDVELQDDGWRRALALLGSCTESELADVTLVPDALLFRLFHEAQVRAYPSHSIVERCRCSRERIERVLRILPGEEIDALIEDGQATVTCEFCARPYLFSRDELAAFAAS